MFLHQLKAEEYDRLIKVRLKNFDQCLLKKIQSGFDQKFPFGIRMQKS